MCEAQRILIASSPGVGVVGTARYQQELVGAVRFFGLSFLVAMQGGPFCWAPKFGVSLFGGARSELFSHKHQSHVYARLPASFAAAFPSVSAFCRSCSADYSSECLVL